MLASERQKKILDHVILQGSATTEELCRFTGASAATIRRDINKLAAQQLLLHTHGGAQAVYPDPAVLSGRHVLREDDPNLSLKEALARKATDLVEDGDVIYIGAGMTCNLLSRHLSEKSLSNITVATTNVTAVMELAHNSNVKMLLMGGNINAGRNHIETIDNYTAASLEKYFFKKVFFTVDGADLQYGYSIINREQISLYNYLLENSEQQYLLVSREKFGKRAFTIFAELDRIPNIITNFPVPDDYLNFYTSQRINVILA